MGEPAVEPEPQPEPQPDPQPEPEPQPEPDGGILFAEDFSQSEGEGWPEPWVISGGVSRAFVQEGMGCLVPSRSNYSLARMFAPGQAQDVEATFVVQFSDLSTQGVGFYVHANGGYLAQTDPPGAGYAVFVEGFRGLGIGVWREREGSEEDLTITFDDTLALVDNVRYRVRLRVTSYANATDVRARVWPEGSVEPRQWQVQAVDATPSLQGLSGGFAVDSWTTRTPNNPGPDELPATCVDDIEIYPHTNPLLGGGEPELLAQGFGFTEGPLWLPGQEVLLFSDIPNNTIYQLNPGEPQVVALSPSGNSNGLALAPSGDLIVCEHAGRVVSYTDLSQPPTVLAQTFEGQPLHSPNDAIVRSDGTIYFTDPPYGRPGANPGPQPFIGVYRIAPNGVLTAEERGPLDARYNGIALSPDESVLYVTNSSAGTLTAWTVAPDGHLENPRVLADDLPVADGLVVDAQGNLYVTAQPGVVVMDSTGSRWGVISLPRQPSNCDLAGSNLYITARDHVYRVSLPALLAR